MIKENENPFGAYRIKELGRRKIKYADKDIIKKVLEDIKVDKNGVLKIRFAAVGVRL